MFVGTRWQEYKAVTIRELLIQCNFDNALYFWKVWFTLCDSKTGRNILAIVTTERRVWKHFQFKLVWRYCYKESWLYGFDLFRDWSLLRERITKPVLHLDCGKERFFDSHRLRKKIQVNSRCFGMIYKFSIY